MKTYFSQLEIDHATYDTIEILSRSIAWQGFSKAFYVELQKNSIEKLMDLYVLPLEEVLNFDCYKPIDIHGLLTTAKEHNLKFGELPEWVLHFKTNWKDFDVERFLHAKLYSVSWPFQKPSLTHKEWHFLKEELGVERVYQFLRIDREKLLSVKYVGKKISESLDYFIEQNEIDGLKLTGKHPAKK